MRPIVSKKHHFGISLLTILLVAYLLLFSSFALFHAYSENELVDSHGCAVGSWVQHCQAPLPFPAGLALFLISLFGSPLSTSFFPKERIALQKGTRAPPRTFPS